jgi:ribose transport system substrate-binding protein
MQKSRTLPAIAAVCCASLAVALSGVATSSASPYAGKAQHHASKLKAHPYIGFANETDEGTFQRDVAAGIAAQAKKFGDKLVSLTNAATDATALKNASVIADDHVTVAIEFQEDAKIGPEIATMFKKAGIKYTIAIDIPQPGAIFFGSSNWTNGFNTGIHLGLYAKSHKFNSKDTYVLEEAITTAGATVALRMQGELHGILKYFPGIPHKQIILQNAGGTTSKAETLVAEVLPRIPTNDHIIVTNINTQTGLGALRALQVAGRAKLAIIGAQGLTPIGIAAIKAKNSHWIGDTAYFPEDYGSEVFKLIADFVAGRKVAPYVYIPAVWITKKSIDKYYPGKDLRSVKTPGALVFSKTIPHVKTGVGTRLAYS